MEEQLRIVVCLFYFTPEIISFRLSQHLVPSIQETKVLIRLNPLEFDTVQLLLVVLSGNSRVGSADPFVLRHMGHDVTCRADPPEPHEAEVYHFFLKPRKSRSCVLTKS